MKRCSVIVFAALGLSGCADTTHGPFRPLNGPTGPASIELAHSQVPINFVMSSGPEAKTEAPYSISYLEQGRAALAEGSASRAERAFRLSIAHEGESALALTGLGVAYDQIGRSGAARVFLERAVELEPTSAIARNNLGVHLWRNGETELAILHLERGAELAGDNEILARNLELVASSRSEPALDGGLDSETDARLEDGQASVASAQTGRAGISGPSAASSNDRLEGFAVVRSGARRFQLRSADTGSVTAPQKPRYHLYEKRIAPNGL